MEFQILEESVATLAEQAELSIAFEYDRILELTTADNGLDGLALAERNMGVLQKKNYDSIDGEGPSSWSERFDVSNWGFIVARSNGQRIGGAVIAFDTPDVEMLERRRDLAVLWDIRVSEGFRSHGVGPALFHAAEQWAAQRKCRQLKIETQNTNLAACRFYMRQGCVLGAMNRFAYPALPNEIQMLWYKNLTSVDL